MALPDRQSWTSDAPCVRGFTIREYDLEAAGLSVIREGGLVPEEEASALASLPKAERLVRVGLLCRDRPEVLDAVEEGTKRAVGAFCEANGIGADDIISVKRDAVFTLVQASVLEVGRHLRFREAARYSSYYNLSGVEFYYQSRRDELTVKGLGGRVLEAHGPHLLSVLRGLMRAAEGSSREALMRSLADRRRRYVRLELEEECYREMNSGSMFRLRTTLAGHELRSESFPGWGELDPIYNYMSYLVPLVAALV